MASRRSQPSLDTDPFDTLLTLEDTLYTSAYSAGISDGARVGRIEGRIFGLEKGFEKFAALGELHGRSAIWGSRVLPTAHPIPYSIEVKVHEKVEAKEAAGDEMKTLNPLLHNSRLANHITLLHSLTDPETFSTDNTEEAVADFDDRFKRAGAKAKVIERIVGEKEGATSSKSLDMAPARGKRNARIEKEGKSKPSDDSMEDFTGSRLLR